MIAYSPFFLGVDVFMTIFFVMLFFSSRNRENRIIFSIAGMMWLLMSLGQIYLAFFGPINVR